MGTQSLGTKGVPGQIVSLIQDLVVQASHMCLCLMQTEELLQAIHASPRPVEWEVGQRSHYVSFLLKMLKLDWSDADVELLCD